MIRRGGDLAIRLNPNFAPAYYNRGIALFEGGKFAEAALAFQKATQLESNDVYAVIRLYLARARAGQSARDELLSSTRTFDLAQWPAPIITFYVGQMASQALLDATKHPVPKTHRERLRDVTFYIGQQLLIEGRRDEAVRMCRSTLATGLVNFVGYEGATAELTRMGF